MEGKGRERQVNGGAGIKGVGWSLTFWTQVTPVCVVHTRGKVCGTIVDGWPAPKVTKYVNYNSHLNN